LNTVTWLEDQVVVGFTVVGVSPYDPSSR
jgi:hypothetical protein